MKSPIIGISVSAAAGLMAAMAMWNRHRAARAEAAYPPAGQFVEAGGVKLHYVRAGSGPPVVLLHGSDGFLQDFTLTLFPQLTSRYDCIAFDRPGHGYSEAPRNETSTAAVQARMLHDALRQLGVERPIFVGHSWSGSLLMRYQDAYPEEIAGLVLVGAVVYPLETTASLLLYMVRVPIVGSTLFLLLLAPFKNWIIDNSLRSAFHPHPVPEAYARMARALWLRSPRHLRAFAEENTTYRADLSQISGDYDCIRCPTVIVTGTDDLVVQPAAQSYRLHHALPASELIRVESDGHELIHAHPEAILRALDRCIALGNAQSLVQSPGSAPQFAAAKSPVARARELVFRYGWNATAYQILSPDMEYWFSADGDAVVGYVRHNRVRVAAGAPICAEDRLTAVAEEFEDSSRAAGDRVCYFGAAERLRAALSRHNAYGTLVLGSQPVWDPVGWKEIAKSSLRAQLNRARNKGVSVSEWSVERANGNLDLQRCLDAWLESRPLPPMHFLTEAVALDRLADRRIFVAEVSDRPVAFLIATPVPHRNGWLVEQIARENTAPNGTAELLVDTVMRALADAGAGYVTLGLAPLSKRGGSPPVRGRHKPGVRLVLAWLRAHGRRFYNFEGLDAFKAKFRPDYWEPLYAISNERSFSFRTLYAIAAAFSDGPPVISTVRAVYGAVRQEAAWLSQRIKKFVEPNRSAP